MSEDRDVYAEDEIERYPGEFAEALTIRPGQVIPHPARPVATIDPFAGVAAQPFDEKAQTVLAKYQAVPDEWLDCKPNGQIYLAHMKLRAIFNEAFGFGGWAIVPVGDTFQVEDDGGDHVIIYREYKLYVSGRFCGQAMGAGDYWKNNPEQNKSDACESAQSYALNRLGKPFGIASQCWDKSYVAQWQQKYAEQYEDRKGRTQWRKKGGTLPSDAAGKWVDTGEPVPGTYWKDRDKSLIGGPGHKAQKTDDGKWHIFELKPA